VKPVVLNAFDIIGDMKAASITHFGAAVIRSASGTIKPANSASDTNILGLAVDDNVVRDTEGFYSQYDTVPILTAGRGRAWVTPNGQNVNIEAGDYLEVAALGSSPTGNHGVLEEAGATAGATRTAVSVARALEDVTMGSDSYKTPSSNVSIGDTQITFTSSDLSAMNLSVGDYIVLEDLTGDVQVNRVADLSSTQITLQLPSTVALVAADSDRVTKLYQCEVMLL